MHVTMHIEEGWFHTEFPRVMGPYGSQVLRAGTTCRHYATLWSHANGRSMGYLRVIWSRVERYVRVPYMLRKFTCGHPIGLCGFHMGVGTSIRSRADAVRAWEYLYDQWYRALRGPVRTRISHRFSSFWPVWGPWTARDLHVTEVFGWFRTEFPRAIDSYDTQTRKGTRASHVTWYYLVAKYDSRTYKPLRPEKEKHTKERER